MAENNLILSLYGFEIYLIKNQYVPFYLNQMIPHNSIFTEQRAINIIYEWIKEQQAQGYNGPTAYQFKSKYNQIRGLNS